MKNRLVVIPSIQKLIQPSPRNQVKNPKTTKKTRRPTPTTPRYTCCVAAYYRPGTDETEIVRMTATVVELSRDEIVDHREFWGPRVTQAADDAIHAFYEMGARRGATLIVLRELVPLEPCANCEDCGRYMMRTITSRDLVSGPTGSSVVSPC